MWNSLDPTAKSGLIAAGLVAAMFLLSSLVYALFC